MTWAHHKSEGLHIQLFIKNASIIKLCCLKCIVDKHCILLLRDTISFSFFRFAQGVIIVHFVTLILLWITRDMGGQVGWGHIFKDS